MFQQPLFSGLKTFIHKKSELFDILVKMKGTAGFITEHTINVLRYGVFHELGENEMKRLALCAFFHDIGTSKVNKKVLGTERKLTDKEY